VTGAGGQVGTELARLVPTARLHLKDEVDVTDESVVRRALGGAEVVVHLAAFTDVDMCEVEAERAFEVNARGTENVARAAVANGARVVYLSTDYVFDGKKDGEYFEDDPPRPLNVYGRSKLAGERAVLEAAANLVVRTSWVYGRGRNFVATILGAARDRKSVV
jgi:dTDP-4-dehydrorhamnose reductase